MEAVPVRIAVAYLIIWSYCSAMMSHRMARFIMAGAKHPISRETVYQYLRAADT